MATRTVRLDKETEKVLSDVRAATGLPISATIKRSLCVLQAHVRRLPTRTAFEVYQELDLGPGGYSVAAASESRRGVRLALKRKLGR
jgi:hypothetical protein